MAGVWDFYKVLLNSLDSSFAKGLAHSAGLALRASGKMSFGCFGLQIRLLGLQNRLPKFISFFASIFYRKNCENHGFWPPKTLPKPSQNPLKIDVPKNMRFFMDFC